MDRRNERTKFRKKWFITLNELCVSSLRVTRHRMRGSKSTLQSNYEISPRTAEIAADDSWARVIKSAVKLSKSASQLFPADNWKILVALGYVHVACDASRRSFYSFAMRETAPFVVSFFQPGNKIERWKKKNWKEKYKLKMIFDDPVIHTSALVIGWAALQLSALYWVYILKSNYSGEVTRFIFFISFDSLTRVMFVI